MSEDAPSSSEEKRFFGRLRKGLAKTRDQITSGVGNLLLGEKEISAQALEDLETALLTTDVGVETTRAIIDELTTQVAQAVGQHGRSVRCVTSFNDATTS